MTWLIKLALKFGLPTWVVPLVMYLALIGAAFGIVWAIYDCGKRGEREVWVAKESAELVKRQEKILRLTSINRALERKAVIEAEYFKNFYEGKLQDEKNHANAVIADVRAGAKRLYITTKAVPACSGGVSLTSATRPEAGGETRTELSRSSSEALIKLTDDANKEVIEANHVKDRLIQCYAHFESIRKLSTGANASVGGSEKPSNLTTSLQLSSQLSGD